MTLVVGQELWYVSNYRYGKPTTVKILKIGRKWATLDRGTDRIDKNTLWADGGNYTSPGRCWLSKAAYEEHLDVDKAWTAFWQIINRQYRAPDGVTVEKIAQAAAILGINDKIE